MTESAQFRPERRIAVAQLIAVSLAIPGVAMMITFGISERQASPGVPLAVAVALLFVALSLCIRGSLRMRVELGPDAIRVVGMLRTLVVPRAQVTRIEGQGEWVRLIWTDERGRSRVSTVSALVHRAAIEWIAPGSRERRQLFIQRANAWAGQCAELPSPTT